MVRRQAPKPVESEGNPPARVRRKRESLPAPTITVDQFEDVAEYIQATRNVDLSADLLAALRASKESGKGKAGPIESLGGSKEAAENWDDAPAPGSQNPEPKQEPGPKPDPAPAEPTDKVSQDAAASTLKDAAANLPADPKSDEVAQRLRDIAEKLPARPKTQLVAAFKEVALVVGADKAKRLLVEEYGTENPEDLKASQLMDAIDDLYGAG